MKNLIFVLVGLAILGLSLNSCMHENDLLIDDQINAGNLDLDATDMTAYGKPSKPRGGGSTPIFLPVPSNFRDGSALSINNQGEIVGYFSTESTSTRPIYWSSSQDQPLDLGLPDGLSYARATSISDEGHIVGASHVIQSSDYAIQFRPGTPTVLDGVIGYGLEYAWAVNNFGLISGSTYNVPGIKASYAKGIYWENGQLNEIGKFENEAWTVAYGNNDAGTIVGYSRISGAVNTPFSWNRGVFSALPYLGQGYGTQKAYDINNNGLIVGASQDANRTIHPVLWEDGELIDLGIIPGNVNGGWAELLAVNDNGEAVGWANGTDGRDHAILYKNGKMTQLSEPDNAFITKAFDINNAGQVVGETYYFDGSRYIKRPVLWATEGGGSPKGGKGKK